MLVCGWEDADIEVLELAHHKQALAEVDFGLNYDVKYRLGVNADED